MFLSIPISLIIIRDAAQTLAQYLINISRILWILKYEFISRDHYLRFSILLLSSFTNGALKWSSWCTLGLSITMCCFIVVVNPCVFHMIFFVDNFTLEETSTVWFYIILAKVPVRCIGYKTNDQCSQSLKEHVIFNFCFKLFEICFDLTFSFIV
jgi:hypothetical protein